MNLELHPKQSIAFQSQATEILYGGAAGGGKSHLMRVCAISWCLDVPGLQVYLFRRTYPDLWKNHMEGPSSFPALVAEWVASGFVRLNLSDGQVIFGNGSKIHLCHCQHEKDVLKFQGAEIHALLMDELTHFSEKIYRFLRGRCRLGAFNLPEKWEGLFPRILAGANPGGIGHHWVKATFIDGFVPLEIRQVGKKEGGMLRQYIPAKLEDNPTMDEDYADKLEGLGNETLVRAMLDGDWEIIAGAYFTEFSRDKHVIKPFSIPAHWNRYRCFDWGSAKPFACYWIAVSDGEMARFPRGAMIVYREYYGMADEPNKGLKMPADRVAQEIFKRDQGETTNGVTVSVADPAIFTADGGPSIADTMRKEGVRWRHADNKRKAGWEQLRIRLNGDDDGKPLLYIFETCVHLIRTLPALQHDENDPEDVDSDQEDHACVSGDTEVFTEKGIERIDSLVGRDGKVLSIDGKMCDFTNAKLTIRNADVLRLLFEDGRELICTPNHKILTVNGFVFAKDSIDMLSYAYIDRRPTCNRPLLARQSRNLKAFATTFAGSIFRRKTLGCIESSMSETSGRSLTDFTFTTKTGIDLIIIQTILSWPQSIHTYLATWTKRGAKTLALWLTKLGRLPLSGISLKRGGLGTGRITPLPESPCTNVEITSANIATSYSKQQGRGFVASHARPHGEDYPESMTRKEFVQSAEINLSPINMRSNLPARPHAASLLRIVSVQKFGRRNVYCLYVPETNAFAANGVITHNSDALRYGCMARPIIRDGARAKKGPKPGTFAHLLEITDEPKTASKYRSLR